jgi:hypothetical protein
MGAKGLTIPNVTFPDLHSSNVSGDVLVTTSTWVEDVAEVCGHKMDLMFVDIAMGNWC